MVLNTSLNVNGAPIAGYKADAKKLFDTSDLDVLVIGDEIITK
jgi:predicted NodU family carbamoyl transferase